MPPVGLPPAAPDPSRASPCIMEHRGATAIKQSPQTHTLGIHPLLLRQRGRAYGIHYTFLRQTATSSVDIMDTSPTTRVEWAATSLGQVSVDLSDKELPT